MRRVLTFTDSDVALMLQIQVMLIGKNPMIRLMYTEEDNLLAAAGGYVARGSAVTDVLVMLRDLVREDGHRE